jgi:chorismate dehydratase
MKPIETLFQYKSPVVRVGRISYMNVAPVYYGLNNGDKPRWMDMVSAPPSTLNHMLAEGELDISPVSSAAYAIHHDKWLLLPDLSISCFGPVMSVLLVSRKPLEELENKKVILTRESATAAALTRYLFASRGIRPHIETGKILSPEDLNTGADAALVIGDAALKSGWDRFEHVWDLGDMWREHTGLPFVFALWAVRKSFAIENPDQVSAVIEQFYRSRETGLGNIDRILPLAAEQLGITEAMCRKYYARLDYGLPPLQVKGLDRFFDGLYREGLISWPVRLSFFQSTARPYVRSCAA